MSVTGDWYCKKSSAESCATEHTETDRLMELFEHEFSGYKLDIEKCEDEFSTMYYLDLRTRDMFMAFCVGRQEIKSRLEELEAGIKGFSCGLTQTSSSYYTIDTESVAALLSLIQPEEAKR